MLNYCLFPRNAVDGFKMIIFKNKKFKNYFNY